MLGSTGTAPTDWATAAPPPRSDTVFAALPPASTTTVSRLAATTAPGLEPDEPAPVTSHTTRSTTATMQSTASTTRATSRAVVARARSWRAKKSVAAGGRDAMTQNCTRGASRVSGRSGAISHSAATSKWKAPASTLPGKVSRRLL